MPELTLQQYLILSVLAFRGEGIPYNTDDLARDVGIAKSWLAQWADDPIMSRWCDCVLSGDLFVGVVDGQVALRPSGKGGESEE